MKKLISLFVIMFLMTPASTEAIGVGTLHKKKNKEISFIAKKKAQIRKNRVENREIRNVKHVMKLLEKYSNAHDTNAILTLYDKDYKSFDGFKYDTYKEMLDETFKAYDDISYESHINHVSLYDGNKAVVNLVDITKATLNDAKTGAIKEMSSKNAMQGNLEGECNYAVYLRKINGEWKIVGDNVISETTAIKYGNAKNISMEFIAPNEVKKDEEYCLTLNVDVPRGTKAIASLSNEEIAYPSVEPKEIFRKIPQSGTLERVVRANKTGLNEYGMASVGFTKIDILEDLSAIRFEMTGLAFLMQRINSKEDINPLREVKKEVKNAQN